MMDVNRNRQAELVLSPEGHVYLNESNQVTEYIPDLVFEKLKILFTRSASIGLLHLGIQEFNTPLPSSFVFWQSFSRKFVAQVCKLNQAGENQILPLIPAPEKTELQEVINQALFIKGIEYLNMDVLTSIWENLSEALKNELKHFSGHVQDYLKLYNPRWNAVGRVCFHLAENKKDEERPFAFLATYTTHLSQQAIAQHLPLKRALQEYAGEQHHAALLALLLPVQKAADQSPFIKKLVDLGTIFQAQTWSAREAYCFLKDIPLMESSGVVVRVPNWWSAQNPPRPKVKVTLGESQSATVGLNTLLDFNMHVALNNGEQLTREEWQALLNAPDKLVKIKGTWVEVDRDKLETVLSHWKKLQQASRNGLSMAEGMRLLAGADSGILTDHDVMNEEMTAEWSTVSAGGWLKSILKQLRNPDQSQDQFINKILQQYLQGSLRPYQIAGVRWLWLLYQLKLGGCLADDMGLGKTIQVLSLLLLIKYLVSTKNIAKTPNLLVVPASLLGNWQAEAMRFAPTLKILIAHSSANSQAELSKINVDQLHEIDLIVTTYGNVYRLPWLKEVAWNLLILDEAQFIKNPNTKQTRSIKTLKSQVRLTLTGTPIENRLSDLWSLFDFTSSGLLGSRKVFSNYAKKAGKDNTSTQYTHFISTLRRLTQPYILRRLKNDKSIISDLPDKTEVQSYCSLSKDQIHLYQQAVDELSQLLETAEGIKRQGLVLSYLLRFKQICNHPTQWLGYGDYNKEASGKFIRLQEICEEIVAKQEKVLIFTQFKEIIPALSAFLTQVFGREGLVLHGGTEIKKRADLVESFQREQGPPFFVLSIKAGGTGLNLTRASHVIHFDRWWNPAVENQATDRAYRIGQKHPVLVHKFICRGTIEEKIDALITSKKKLSKNMLEGDEELALTELTNEQLMDLISLDIQKALGEI
jgi:SNF2-related domain/SNF2 Helicase protein/Helicase conserved C-terminal domain